ncbi:MAG: GIY-YIG nuclease family protein [Spirochaetes bacterium]|nr:MAG: GIY-YIG nuclease family protein [Spirochaetota bacterium]
MGYVYLILEGNIHGEELYKIGITKNDPQLRVKQLQTGNPNQVSLLHAYESKNYKKVEQWMHRKHAQSKTLAKNEWFNLTDEQVFSFIEDCKEADKTISFLLETNPFFN